MLRCAPTRAAKDRGNSDEPDAGRPRLKWSEEAPPGTWQSQVQPNHSIVCSETDSIVCSEGIVCSETIHSMVCYETILRGALGGRAPRNPPAPSLRNLHLHPCTRTGVILVTAVIVVALAIQSGVACMDV
jgi:hypothetical protein